jgi:hypothetical protein
MAPEEQPVATPGGDEGPISVPFRVLAILLALVIAFAAGATIAGAADNTGLPTCHEVNRGDAAPSSNGECFDGSSRRAKAGLGVAIAAGITAAAALLLSIVVAATGRRGRVFLSLCGATVVLIGAVIAVIQI